MLCVVFYLDMNLKELKSIINSDLPDEVIKSEIINSIAKDENVIITIMKVLESERKFKSEMYSEMNLLLSKSHIGLDNKKYNQNNFMQKEIVEFYTKYRGYVGHCFKNLFGS